MICSFAFNRCNNLKHMECKSKLGFIDNSVFFESSIESISIPSCLNNFKEGWCKRNDHLNNIKIIPSDEENVIYYDNTYLIKKSNPKSDVFDELLFARRDIKNAVIPSFVKKISSYAFESCRNLKRVDFLENSELQYIENNAFDSSSSIESIFIPKHVKAIYYNAFASCYSCQKIEFAHNSELELIGTHAFLLVGIKKIILPESLEIISSYAFYNSFSLESVVIPDNSRLKKIYGSAFYDSGLKDLSIPSNIDFTIPFLEKTSKLTNIKILPREEKHIMYYDDKYILGKSDLQSDNFDVLLFAKKDIEKAVIPSFIKIIAEGAFSDCIVLKEIIFLKNSQLEAFGDKSFMSASSLRRILIPSCVKSIGKFCFYKAFNLEIVEFEANSKLELIDEYAFSFNALESFFIPKSVAIIRENAFHYIHLKILEIEEDSELDFIDSIFSSNIEYVMIPHNLKSKFEMQIQ